MTILWYDLETWGLKPAWCPPAQFAGIRTDLDLNVVGDPVMFYAKPPSDMLPEPGAVLTTGITPQIALTEGESEADFARRVYAEISKPGTVTSGYNTLRFDDEMLRYSFYRNLLDPYVRESYKNDLGRWDTLDLVRAARALRPSGLQWPEVDGAPSNRLEELTKANGIEHEGAHDALVDVRATIALAKLVKQAQPKLYEYGWSLRNKPVVTGQLQEALASGKAIVHTTGMYPNATLNTSLAYVFAHRSDRKNEYLLYDLRYDPSEFIDLSEQDIKRRLFGSEEDRNGESRIPVKGVNVGKSPFVAPAEMLESEAEARIQLTHAQALEHREVLIKNPEFLTLVQSVFESHEFEPNTDVDAQLYDGFPSNSDRTLLNTLSSNNPSQWSQQLPFDNPKYLRLAKRYVARNYPESLSEQDRKNWEQFRAQKLMQDSADWQTYPRFSAELQQLAKEHADSPGKIYLLEELHLYAESIYPAPATLEQS